MKLNFGLSVPTAGFEKLRDKKKNSSSLGFLFWQPYFLLVVVLDWTVRCDQVGFQTHFLGSSFHTNINTTYVSCVCVCSSHRVATHYVYPQAFVQPSVVIPHVQPTAAAPAAASSPYIDYTGAAYAQYSAAAASTAAAVAYEQYPYAASPAAPGYVATTGYGFAVQQPLAAAAPGASAAAAAAAFGQYQAQQLQADRMQ